jgi:hypothetical protein
MECAGCDMKKQSKRGGKRKGAGSKPKPIDQTKPIQKGFRCSMEVGEFLAEVGTGFIEDVIRVSEAFKRWSKGK